MSITSPAVGQTVTGTYQVQVDAEDDSGVTNVNLYARGRGHSGPGVLVGSATSSPFVISWYTPALPNLADLELIAEAEDGTGNRQTSAPVAVKTSNPNTPSLSYLVAYTLPRTLAGLKTSALEAVRQSVSPEAIQPPQRATRPQTLLRVQAAPDPNSSYIMEWAWQPVQAASGYRIWQARDDIAGPYSNVFNQLATTGTQKFSRTVPDAAPGVTLTGTVTSLVGGQEGPYSNADQATFLPTQELDTPAAGAAPSTRPTFTWKATPGAGGYLWFVSKKPQAQSTAADWVCTNSPQSTDQLALTYPNACPALTTGTYYWWVAGVAFNEQRLVDAFSFSPDRQLTIP